MSDMVLVINKNKKKTYEAHIFLNPNSFVEDIPNSKYYNNIFSVSGKNKSVTFLAKNEDLKIKVINQVN